MEPFQFPFDSKTSLLRTWYGALIAVWWKGGVGKTTTSTATAVHLADCGFKVLLVSSDPAHSTSDSLDCEIGTEPTPIEGVNGLYGLEMDPESKLSSILPKLGNMVDGMNSGGGLQGLGGLGMMF